MLELKKNMEKVSTFLNKFKETGVLNHIYGKSEPALAGEVF